MTSKPDPPGTDRSISSEIVLWLIGAGSAVKLRYAAPIAVVSLAFFHPGSIHGGTVFALPIAVAVASSHSAGVLFRRFKTPHRLNPRVLPLLRLEAAVTVLLWLTALLIKSAGGTLAGLFGASLLYAFACLGDATVAVRVRKIVGVRTRTFYVRRLVIPIVGVSVGKLVSELADTFDFPPFTSLAKLFARRRRMSLYAYVFVFILANLATANAVAALITVSHAAKRTPPDRHSRAHARRAVSVPSELAVGSGDQNGSVPAGGTSGGTDGNSPPLNSAEPAPLTWEDICGALPGFDAPSWARAKVFDLLLGTGGPGAIVAGCTGSAEYLSGRNDFVYLIGRAPDGKERSVVVVSQDSERLPAAIFLAPAVKPVLRIIESAGPVGGYLRIDAGDGDAYLVYGAEGTWVLIRAHKVLEGNPGLASPYVELPPAVADELYATIIVQGQWLWASKIADDARTGYETFVFTRVRDATPVLTVLFDPVSRAAFVEVDGRLVPHYPEGRRLDGDALNAIAQKCVPTGAPVPSDASC